MKRIDFFNTNRSEDIMHIETEGAIVNIHVNLVNMDGKKLLVLK